MPFAGYKNFNDCVRRNQDKKDPKAYCAAIQRQVEENNKKMKNNPFEFRKFIPITKVDEDERMVFGFASTPDLDSDGEIISLKALKKALPGYLQFPTIREMHQAKAAGTTKNAEIREGKNEGLYIGAKIVAEDAWNLVKEGVYKGFSVGGHVINKVGNMISEMELIEISLVDVPANKKAKIELWKSKNKDMKKNAETVFMLSNLMIQLKDVADFYKAIGKNNKKITRALELIKQTIASEAEEKESDEPMGIFAGDLKTKIDILEKTKFDDNLFAEFLRKGVIEIMKQKTKELEEEKKTLKKQEDTDSENEEKDENLSEEESTETEANESDTSSEEETSENEEATESEDDSEESKDIQKVEEASAKLDKMASDKENTEKVATSEAIKSLSTNFIKVVNVLQSLEKRISTLEETPAAPKSKSSLVFKSQEDKKEQTNKAEDSTKESNALKQKQARLEKLYKLFDELGANEFAKRGYSIEAGKIEGEIAQLKAKAE